jgi:hypothetical protein
LSHFYVKNKKRDYVDCSKPVEIFRTEVSCPKTAAKLLQLLHEVFPNDKFNFDLEDCDRILRVDSPHLEIEAIPSIYILGAISVNGLNSDYLTNNNLISLITVSVLC